MALNESLKQQEKDFRSSCGKERKRLQELLASELTAEDEEELQRIEMIDQTYQGSYYCGGSGGKEKQKR